MTSRLAGWVSVGIWSRIGEIRIVATMFVFG
jgi:hypothetical protein